MMTSAATVISRRSMIRLSANGVPTKRNGAGENSPIDGPWNPLLEL
jgi:hypothetical protein